MKLTEEMVKEVILEVLQQMQNAGASPVSKETQAEPLEITEIGDSQTGTDKKEIVVGLPPAFGVAMTQTIIKIPHQSVLKEIMAGIEEEGLKVRMVRVNRTADVGFIAHEAAKLSGSGIGIGTISRGTTVIHQRDLAPLQNLEIFPQSPLVELDTFRAIGKNAAKYAKGENPAPVPVRNDPMARPKYQGLAALLHNKETQFVNPDLPSKDLAIRL